MYGCFILETASYDVLSVSRSADIFTLSDQSWPSPVFPVHGELVEDRCIESAERRLIERNKSHHRKLYFHLPKYMNRNGMRG